MTKLIGIVDDEKLDKCQQWLYDRQMKQEAHARNAFEYLQMIYIARNYSYWPTFLLLIVWVYIH